MADDSIEWFPNPCHQARGKQRSLRPFDEQESKAIPAERRVIRRFGVVACSAALLLYVFLFALATAAEESPSPVAAAISDADRPAEDIARDNSRKPAETLLFAGIKPGDRIADYIANSGYFTRLLANTVGPNGHVYAVELNEVISFPNVAKGYAELKAWAKTRPSVTIDTQPASQAPAFPQPLDVFWISQNYHDLHDKFLGPVDIGAFNKAVYAALKPGGVYIVIDHVAAEDAPANVTETLHRIQPSVVRREIEAAGFHFEGESRALENTADPHTKEVFDASIQGHTDQFLYKFRRPSKPT